MIVADLVAALLKMPQDAEVIVPEVIDGDDEGAEVYAKAQAPVVRWVGAFALDHINWDFTPTIEPWDGARQVVLIASVIFERTEHLAPAASGAGLTYPAAHSNSA